MSTPDYTYLAQLHWISYTMPARLHGLDSPMWEDLPEATRACLTTAMEMMITTGHLHVGVPS